MEDLAVIKQAIAQGDVENALHLLDAYLATDSPLHRDTAYYLRGNAYRKSGNWQQALNNYQSAVDINPDSPAAQARQAVIEILNFYNKEMYNQ
jgi:tetratricopeptide (TPR) repeat protein